MRSAEQLEKRHRIHATNQKRFNRYIYRTAWNRSREHLAWAYPLGTAILVSGLIWLIQGRDKALEDVVSSLIVGGATVIAAAAAYGLSLRKAASINFADQIEAVETIERERDEALEEVAHSHALSNSPSVHT